jgi:hypothetical protein
MESGVHCSAESNPNGLKFTDDLEGLNEWKHSWPEREISYRLNNFSDDLKEKWQTRAVTVALRIWQLRLSKLKFRRERNPDAHVDFNVSFEDLDHFDGKRGVFAHAYYPGQGEISGDCHINDDWDWVAATKWQTLAKPPLVPVLCHEFGHSIGLTHDTRDVGSIMYPSFNLGQQKYKLGPRDIARIQTRYTGRTLSQRIYDRMALRRLSASDFR